MNSCTGYVDLRDDPDSDDEPLPFPNILEAHCELETGHTGDHIYRVYTTVDTIRGSFLENVTITWENKLF